MARDPLDHSTADLPGVGQRIGYARKSKDEQDLALQLDALKRAGCHQVYAEQVSRAGPKRTRKGAVELDNALRAVRAGDTFVVWRLDRLGGSVSELIRIVTKELRDRGVAFESLTEKIDTTTAAGNMFFQIAAVFAEYERNLLIERTHAGLRAARARGKKGGRPRKLDAAQVAQVRSLMADPKIDVSKIAKQFGVSRTTLYKYVNEPKGSSRARNAQ